VFVRGGYHVPPAAVEAVLLDHPGVAAVAVAPRPDPVMGEVGVAVVVPVDPGRPPTVEELRAFAAGRLASYEWPEAVLVVDALPLNAGDKIDRRSLISRVRALWPEGGRT
jgi:acyl-CoA synthetase (AMP-forming)/AMP-acid ligase II